MRCASVRHNLQLWGSPPAVQPTGSREHTAVLTREQVLVRQQLAGRMLLQLVALVVQQRVNEVDE